MRPFVALIILLLASLAGAIQTTVGPYRVDVVTNPATIPVGRANLVVTVTDAGGQPVTGKTVRTLARMPGMNMGEREETARPGDRPGQYVSPAAFPMGGLYEIVVTIDGQSGTVEMRTGQTTTAASEDSPWPTVVLVAVAILIGGFVIYRMRKTGQRVNAKGIFNLQVLGSLLLLGTAVAVAVWAVNTKRRPGAMTPIEAQVMEMNMPAPEGTLPVELATAELRSFAATVTYSGEAVGFVEQNVVPRVTGTIEWMPGYVGDRVRKGQLLARLDTSQIDPEVAERSAGVAMSNQGVEVAVAEYEKALEDVRQARSELAIRRASVEEARTGVTAAREEKAAAESEVAAARTSVANAEAEVAAMEADQTYQNEELGRMRTLFAQGAVSKDEFQRAQAAAASAAARVRQAQAGVREAQARVRAAQANSRKAEAMVAAAQTKVAQATAELNAQHAQVRSAQAMTNAARKRIDQARAGVRQSQAGLRGAAVQREYAQLRAEADGIIVERLVSPGQVAVAGQPVLRVAQVSPIRLQANVPESDLARITVGARARVSPRDGGSAPVDVRVTSVAPSLDRGARTGIVEALYGNRDGRFRPGQYVTMEVTTSESPSAVVIPTSALQPGNFVWVAEEGMNGVFEVRRQSVTPGARAGDTVAVREGLEPGQRVVASPAAGLRDGVRVTTTTKPSTELTVRVTERGYSPASVEIPANTPVKLTFLRQVDPSCGDKLVFPELKIERDLPFNKPVTIDIPPRPAGELKFACGMDMYVGKVVIR